MKKERLGSKTAAALKAAFGPLKTHTHLSPGKAIRIYRKAQGWTQGELAAITGIRQATLSALENDRITLGLDRAKVLARALRVHPAVLAFPSWDV